MVLVAEQSRALLCPASMRSLTVDLSPRRYDVLIEPGLLQRLGPIVRAVAPHGRCAVLSDEAVYAHFGAAAAASLATAGYTVSTAAFAAGETNKNLTTVSHLYEVLLSNKLERKSPVIALGGGVTGDMVGFAAATYLRGVPFIQCPTTLLSMVDASVGGKVGVNVPQGKNLIGAFYQPSVVVVDPETLRTLSPRELRCGLAECLKHGLLGDAELFAWTEANVDKILALDMSALSILIERNVAIKARIVMEDEKEQGIRAWLNLGHTFAHAIEATTGYATLFHGEAVGLGLIAATWLSIERGSCDASLLARLRALIERSGLPARVSLPSTAELMAAMSFDKKAQDGKLRLILLDGLGKAAIVSDTDTSLVARAWDSIRG